MAKFATKYTSRSVCLCQRSHNAGAWSGRFGKLLKTSYFEISAFMQVIPAPWDEPCEIQSSSCNVKNILSFAVGQMMILKLQAPSYAVAKSKIPAEFSDYPPKA